MPDLDRLFDKLRIDIAEAPEDKARAEAFIEGKSHARKEILYIVIFFFAVGLILHEAAANFL